MTAQVDLWAHDADNLGLRIPWFVTRKLTPPTSGGVIRFDNGQPVVPDNPIVPFIRGDGTGVDIWPATQKVIDAAVAKAYGGSKAIKWFKVYAGDEAQRPLRHLPVPAAGHPHCD